MGILKKLFHKDTEQLTDAGWYLKAMDLWNWKGGNFFYPAKALKYLDQAIRLNPNKEESYSSRGIAYGQLGKHELSIESFNQAIRLNSNNDANYIGRGRAYVQLGKYERAIEDFNQVIRLNHNPSVGYVNRAVVQLKLGKYERVIEDYTQCISLESSDEVKAVNYFLRGCAYGELLGEQQNAIKDYNQSIRLSPNNAAAYNKRGMAYYLLKNYDQMCKDFMRGCELGDCSALQMAKKQGFCQ